jgi:hypothetical protein
VRAPRPLALTCARLAMLAGPTVLAFFAGGYFDEPRVWAGLIAWALVAVATLIVPNPVPRSRAALLTLGGLALLATWTLLSFTWSPIAGTAYHDGQRVFLYVGGLTAATLLLRSDTRRLAEPVLAGGTLLVIGYGISERLLPTLLQFSHSVSAEGRLEQPLTYWNAMGALAAIGLVLCAHIAGDRSRSARLRMSATAATAPLGLGLYLSFSRGALFACAAGLVALVVLEANWPALRAIAISVAASALSAVASAPFSGVTGLHGSRHHRAVGGAVVLVALIVICAAAALAQLMLIRRERSGRVGTGTLPLPRHAGTLAAAVVVGAFVLFLAVGAKEKSTAPLSSGANRLTTLQSNRYSYWKVAWHDFKSEPLRGVGGGGWAVDWLRYRPFDAGAQDAHSLYIQTAAELGVVGLALLAMFLAGLALAARRAWLANPAAAAGPIAGFVVWGCHVAVDWDWEMPAVTLVAIVLAGALLAINERLSAEGSEPRPLAMPSAEPPVRATAPG